MSYSKERYFIPETQQEIEKLCDDLMTWAHETKKPILAEFMRNEMIPWSVLNTLIENNQDVNFTFELAITFLVVKWYDKAEKEKMSSALLRMMSKYLEAYDLHLFYVDTKKRKIMSDKLMSFFEAKNWSAADIPDPFKKIYEENEKK